MEQYIPKSALVAEIESLLDKGRYHEEYDCAYRDGNNGALYALKNKLDTLEVKEVDLEKEINSIEDKYHGFESLSRNDVIDIARHFANWQKEQMMKDAVDAEIYREIENDDTREYSLHAISHKLDKSKYKFMEKVKVIIIKEK